MFHILCRPLCSRSLAPLARTTDDEAVWEGVRSSTPGAAHCVHFNNAGPFLAALALPVIMRRTRQDVGPQH